MTEYYKPRKGLECSDCLLPQKVENGKQYHYERPVYGIPKWRENYGNPYPDLLAKNFTKVDTEQECLG